METKKNVGASPETSPLIESMARAFVDFHPRYNAMLVSSHAKRSLRTIADQAALRERIRELYAERRPIG